MTAAEAKNHAAVMDKVYRRQRYIYDFTRKYYLFGRDRLIEQMALKPGTRVIEVGCGTARNLIKIARKYPEVALYGLDASAEMLTTARRSLAQAGLAGQVKLIQAYAEELSPQLFDETEPFDSVVFSYSLSMIPDWKQALRAALTALRHDGSLHIVDFGDLKGLPWPIDASLRAWLELFHVAPRDDLLTMMEGSASNELTLLPGRYAFLLSASAATIKTSLGGSVAEWSQAQRKSDSQRPK